MTHRLRPSARRRGMGPSRCVAQALGVVLLSACAATGPRPQQDAALTTATPEQMVASVRAAAGDGEGELAVQPLRDPTVEDLREQARRLEAARDHAGAAAALDRALALVPDDPTLLQERAEVALLARDYERAATLAEQAFGIGSQVGPLCRRHWATVQQVRLVQGDAAGAAAAGARLEACTLKPPPRY